MGKVRAYFVSYTYSENGEKYTGDAVVSSNRIGANLVYGIREKLEKECSSEIIFTAFNEIPSE